MVKIISIMFLLLISLSSIESAEITMGKTGTGGSANTTGANTVILCGPYNPSSNGNITHIRLHAGVGAGTVNVTCGIYTLAAGTYTKVKDTAGVAVSNLVMEWLIFVLDSPLTVSTGTTYYIGYFTDGTINKAYDSPVGTFIRFLGSVAYVDGTMPASVVGTTDSANKEISIYGWGANISGGGLTPSLGISPGNRPPFLRRP